MGRSAMPNRNLRLISVGLGLWVVLSSLLLGHRNMAISVNGWITGAIIVVSALLAIRRPNLRFLGAAGGGGNAPHDAIMSACSGPTSDVSAIAAPTNALFQTIGDE